MTTPKPKGISPEMDLHVAELGEVVQRSGDLDAENIRIGIVSSRFNEELTGGLISNAIRVLRELGLNDRQIELVRVPGAFEIPLVIKKLASENTYSALLALGAVVEGDTIHARVISEQLAAALCDLSLEFEIPVIDAVVTAPSLESAYARCVPEESSRGGYAARTALEMANLIHLLHQ